MSLQWLLRPLARLWRDEGGFVSAETLLSIPLLALPLLVLVDAGQIFEKHSRMWNSARDAARAMARYSEDAAEARQRAQESLGDFAGGVQVLIGEGEAVIVEISANPQVESPFGFVIGGTTRLPARVIMRREPRLLERLG